MYKYSNLSLRSLYELKAFWEDEETRRLLSEHPQAAAHVGDGLCMYPKVWMCKELGTEKSVPIFFWIFFI